LSTRGIQLRRRRVAPLAELRCKHYIRFRVRNAPGTLARIALALGDADVVVEQMVQEEEEGVATVVMTTHEAACASVDRALDAIAAQPFSMGRAKTIRIA